MPINGPAAFPDYDLEQRIVVTAPHELRTLARPLRATLLESLLERAATVSEPAVSVGRPKRRVAHHVNVLRAAGMLKVVRTRKLRAIEERFYARTARLFFTGEVQPEHVDPPPWSHSLLGRAVTALQLRRRQVQPVVAVDLGWGGEGSRRASNGVCG